MCHSACRRAPVLPKSGLGLLSICFLLVPLAAYAQQRSPLELNALVSTHSTQQNQMTGNKNSSSVSFAEKIPAGTILPVVMRSGFSFEKCVPGQLLHGKIAQDVPLPSGAKIGKGSSIEGHIVEVTPVSGGNGAKVSIQFDKLNVDQQWVPMVTDLRALAGFMDVNDAGIPDEGTSEGTPYNWLSTTLIGGDSVYGVGGPVMSEDDTSKVIGRSVGEGILAPASAKEGTRRRGPVNGNDSPQAFWMFSSDACGIYGIEHIKIEHAGRTDPKGTIILAANSRKVGLRGGDGLLLRVNEPKQ